MCNRVAKEDGTEKVTWSKASKEAEEQLGEAPC